jgi:nitrogen fixation/metabolism regulation signal transduction histidine kinase
MEVVARLRVFCAGLSIRACALAGLILAAAVSVAFSAGDFMRAWHARMWPVKALAAAMRRVADGDVEVRIPGNMRKGDLGDMARALEVFRDNLIARRISEAALQRTNAVFDTALQCMLQGMIVWGPNLSVQFVNRRSTSGSHFDLTR